MIDRIEKKNPKVKYVRSYTAIPYRASTGPEQDFPCEVFLTGKNLFSLQGTPFLIAGTLFSFQGFPRENPVLITGNGFAVQPTQLTVQFNSSLQHIIVTNETTDYGLVF